MSNSEFNKSDNEDESSTIDPIKFSRIAKEINKQQGQEAYKFRNYNETLLMELFDEWFKQNRSLIIKQMKHHILEGEEIFDILLDITSHDLILYLFRGLRGESKMFKGVNMKTNLTHSHEARNKGFSSNEVRESFIGYINKKLQGFDTKIIFFNDINKPGKKVITFQITLSIGGTK